MSNIFEKNHFIDEVIAFLVVFYENLFAPDDYLEVYLMCFLMK